jgi:hypothetical protein
MFHSPHAIIRVVTPVLTEWVGYLASISKMRNVNRIAVKDRTGKGTAVVEIIILNKC